MRIDSAGFPWLFLVITLLGVGLPQASEAPHVNAASADPTVAPEAKRKPAANAGERKGAEVAHGLDQQTSARECELAACARLLLAPFERLGFALAPDYEGCCPEVPRTDLSRADLSRPKRPLLSDAGHIRTMIASLPDPKSSGQAYEFDRGLDAITRAIESAPPVTPGLPKPSGYVRDDFYLPWTADSDSTANPCMDQVPGVVLFRSRRDASALLAVVIVGESPTLGPNRAALNVALDFARTYPFEHALRPPGYIQIIGPYFTGTARPLEQAIEGWSRSRNYRGVTKLVTGSASAVSDDLFQAPAFRFEKTTSGAQELLDAYVTLLETRARGEAPRVALLSEAGTEYGQVLGAEGSARSDVLLIPFPRNIAKLRARWQLERRAAADAEAGKALQLAQPVHLRARLDDGVPSDQPQPFSNDTIVSDDLVLASTLRKLGQAGIEHVGIVASAVSDIIFLAQQVHLHLPEARLFVIHSDLILAHPDHEGSLLGAMVVSAYPPASNGVDFTYPFFPAGNTRQAFSRAPAHGLFNATLRVLGRSDLTGYAPPFTLPGVDQGSRPALWISAVGHGGFWPITTQPSTSPYAVALKLQAAPEACPSEFVRAARSWRGSVWLVLLLCSLLVTGVALATLGQLPRLLHFFAALRPVGYQACSEGVLARRHRGARWCLYSVAVFVLLFMVATTTSVAATPLWATILPRVAGACVGFERNASDVFGPSLFGAALFVLTGAAYLRGHHSRKVGARLGVFDPASRGYVAGAWAFVFGALLASAAVLGKLYSGLGREGWWPHVDDAALFYVRVTALDSRLSPLVPLLLLALIVFLSAAIYLERFRLLDAACSGTRGNVVVDCLRITPGHTRGPETDLDGEVSALSDALGRTGSPRWRSVTVGALAGVALLVLLFHHPSTIDGRTGDVGLWIAAIVVLPLTLLNVVTFLHVWVALRRVLRRMVLSPVISGLSKEAKVLLPGLSMPWSGLFLCDVRVRSVRDAALRTWQLSERLAPQWHESNQQLGGALCRNCGPPPAVDADAELGRLVASVDALRPPVCELLAEVPDAAGSAQRAALERWKCSAEEFLLGQIAVAVNYVVQHLRNHLTLTLAAALLTVLALGYYPFQPERLLTTINWLLIVTTLLVTLYVFVQMERNEVLSRLNGTTPGRISWNSDFLAQTLTWVVLPFLAFLASQYPEASSRILRVFSPLATAMH